MSLIRFPLSWLLLLHAVSTIAYADADAVRGEEADLLLAQESSEVNAVGDAQGTQLNELTPSGQGQIPVQGGDVQGQAQGQQNPGYDESQNAQNPRGNQGQGPERDPQQRVIQGQDQPAQIQGEQNLKSGQGQQGQGTSGSTQGQQNYPSQGTGGSTQGQQDYPNQGTSGSTPGQPYPTTPQGQGATPASGVQGQSGQGAQAQPRSGQTQDPLPPDPSQVKAPKKPRVLPSPTPTTPPAPAFIPAPPPEPAPRPQASGPKTTEQRSYESAMQTRWKTAAEELTLLQSRGQNLEGKKGKAFRESFRTASGNRSIARTKLNQLVRGSSADFDKLKTGVERAFADLDSSIARVRSYFDEPPPP